MAKKVEETEPTKAGKAIPVNNYDKVKGVMNKLNTHYKNPNLIKTGDKIPPIYKVPFGEPILDYVSDGGIPIGRITEFLGDNHCIDSSSFIHFQVRDLTGRKQCDKGGTIESLYIRFHRLGKVSKRSKKTENSLYYVQSVDSNGMVFMNRIRDVFKNGTAPCYKVTTTSGKSLISTDQHRYFTPNGYIKLSMLQVGSIIYSYDKGYNRKDYTDSTNYKEVCIKGYHPHLSIKRVGIYEYYRGYVHRLVVEASLNSMSYDEFIEFLNTRSVEEIETLKFLPKHIIIHHKDDNVDNNDLSNLQQVTLKEHNDIHSKTESLKLSIVEDSIESIEFIGSREVYDLSCEDPHNNYIVHGIVVHNSGKTRNALKAMGKFQRYCFNCHTAESLHATWYTDPNDENAIPQLMECHCDNCNNPRTNIQVMVDAEGTTDPDFLELLGVDTQGIIYSRPAMPSQAIGIIETFLAMPDIGLILLDSIGGMGSDKEVVTAIEDEKMNQNALFFNKALRKWQMAFNANTNEFGTESGTSLIVVNQSYTTLDFFAKEVATGGRGLRHGKGLSLKSRIKEKAKLPNSNKILGVHIDYVNEKNKTGMPYRRKDYYLNLDPANTDLGYCQTDVNLQYMELALEQGLIEQRGAWFYFGDDGKWNGREKLMADFPQGAIDMVKKTLYGERR